jgi:hypothetical protein
LQRRSIDYHRKYSLRRTSRHGTRHAFAITNAGAPDVYFDTSAAAANKPAGTTAFRRVGSFLTTGSPAQIVPYTQIGDRFLLATGVLDFNNAATVGPGTYTVTVPSGIPVVWLGAGNLYGNTAAGSVSLALYTPGQTPTNGWNLTVFNPSASAAGSAAGQFQILTNAARQIAFTASIGAAGASLQISTYGWLDRRGQDD